MDVAEDANSASQQLTQNGHFSKLGLCCATDMWFHCLCVLPPAVRLSLTAAAGGGGAAAAAFRYPASSGMMYSPASCSVYIKHLPEQVSRLTHSVQATAVHTQCTAGCCHVEYLARIAALSQWVASHVGCLACLCWLLT